VRDGGPSQVALLHGGPGFGFEYLDSVLTELDGWTVASFQQRGLTPSTTAGPFDIPTAVEDVADVVHHLGWERPVLLGHSWGGWLAWRTVATHQALCSAVLAVDPFGTVGDGGRPAFFDELFARIPRDQRESFETLWASPSREDAVRGLGILWPGYFADPADAPQYQRVRIAGPEVGALASALPAAMSDLEAALPLMRLPMGVLVGGGSPMPRSAGDDVVQRWPGAWIMDAPGAGHFPWLVAPGCVRQALQRLTDELQLPASPR